MAAPGVPSAGSPVGGGDRGAGGAERETRGLVDRLFWSGHANPWSVRTFVLAFPTLVYAIYRRHRPLLVGTLLFVVANPILAPPPADDRAWATRVVLGEQVWLADGVWPSWDLLFAVLAAPIYLFTLGAAARRRPLATAVGTVASMVAMLLFFDRMATRYDERTGRRRPPVSKPGDRRAGDSTTAGRPSPHRRTPRS